MMGRKMPAVKRKRLPGIILSLVVGVSLIAQPMAAFAEELSTSADAFIEEELLSIAANDSSEEGSLLTVDDGSEGGSVPVADDSSEEGFLLSADDVSEEGSLLAVDDQAEGRLTSTVDNSVDKSTTQVIGQFTITYSCSDGDDDLLCVYDSEKVKVDYSNPENEYIKSLIDKAKERAESTGEIVYATSDYASIGTLNPAVTNKSENSYDNRVYTWVQDDESDSGISVGDSDTGQGAVGNQNRHMVIEGDYARTTVYTVVVEIHVDDHLWDEGVVTKEATETETGIRTFTCTKCQETKTEIIPKRNDAQVIIEKPVYRGDIVADGMIHQITEFYDFSGLPEGTKIILNIDGETQYISVPDELQRLEVREPVEILFELELPQGYIFENNAGPSHIMYGTVRVLAAASADDKPIPDPQPESYIFIDGQNGIWEQSSNEALTFRANGDFSKFTGVKVDGSLIDEKYYLAASGSTIVTLTNDYLKTLAVGIHSLTVVYIDGDCSTNFEIRSTQNPVAPENNTADSAKNEHSNQVTTQTVEETRTVIPQTGDNSHVLLWEFFLFFSGSALVGTSIYGKKRKSNKK